MDNNSTNNTQGKIVLKKIIVDGATVYSILRDGVPVGRIRTAEVNDTVLIACTAENEEIKLHAIKILKNYLIKKNPNKTNFSIVEASPNSEDKTESNDNVSIPQNNNNEKELGREPDRIEPEKNKPSMQMPNNTSEHISEEEEKEEIIEYKPLEGKGGGLVTSVKTDPVLFKDVKVLIDEIRSKQRPLRIVDTSPDDGQNFF